MSDTHAKRERLVAGALLVAERDSQAALRATVKRNTLAFASTIADSTEARRHAALVRQMDELQDEAEDDVATVREDARAGSRRAHKTALVALLIGGSRSRESLDLKRKVSETIEGLARKTVPSDVVSARLAAQSVSAAWGKAAGQAIAMPQGPYRTAGEKVALNVTRTVPAAVEPTIRRVSVTQAAEAHNAETRRIHDALPADVRDMIELVWSSVLDNRTCAACEVQDGKRIVSLYPPLHQQCRCCTLHVRVGGMSRTAA